MTEEKTYPFEKAYKAAQYIVDLLKPHCENNRIHIAGSIRRMRPQVKDIEITCQPKKQIVGRNLLQEEEYAVCTEFINALAEITGETFIGNTGGRYMQIKTNSKICPGIRLDLFMPQPDDYYRQYAIRTGSADYAHKVIATAWKKKGWCGVSGIGLRKIADCNCTTDKQNKKIYTLKPSLSTRRGQLSETNNNKKPGEAELPPAWQSEGEFFTWLGLEYIDPEFRETHSSINLAQ